jgi:hypothetical protein
MHVRLIVYYTLRQLAKTRSLLSASQLYRSDSVVKKLIAEAGGPPELDDRSKKIMEGREYLDKNEAREFLEIFSELCLLVEISRISLIEKKKTRKLLRNYVSFLDPVLTSAPSDSEG